MGWEDRPYYRDRGSSGSMGNPLMWLVMGSVPLFTAFGIRVRAHASLIVFTAFILLFGFGTPGFTIQDRIVSSTMLFAIVLLHEFGHCFTARWVGGHAEDILMHPLGGLAFAHPPRRPLPTFLTVAGGPAVNVVICLICGVWIWAFAGHLPLNPFRPFPPGTITSVDVFNAIYYAVWIWQVSYMLLIFNLMPIFPLDGGQMLQAILWPKFGYYKSMIFSCNVGMIGSIAGGAWAIFSGNFSLAVLAAFGFINCLNMKRQLAAAGPAAVSDAIDYIAAYDNFSKPTRQSRAAAKRAAKQQELERVEQAKIDRILEKVSQHGMQSLNWLEKRTLKKATERQREAEVAKMNRVR